MVSVHAGTDPLARRTICFKLTVRTEQQAHIEFGRLLKEESDDRMPESDAAMAELLDEYAGAGSPVTLVRPAGQLADGHECYADLVPGQPGSQRRRQPALVTQRWPGSGKGPGAQDAPKAPQRRRARQSAE